MKLLFEVINVSKDNSITEYQWRHFYNIFVIPFNECDTDKDMWLNEDELRVCYTLPTL